MVFEAQALWQNEWLPLLPTGSRRRGRVRGKQRQASQAPGPWLTALRARGLVSPETGLNGSSNSALALPHWKAEPDKGRHCVLLQRPRGRPSMGPQTGTRPGSRPCNSRQASALRGVSGIWEQLSWVALAQSFSADASQAVDPGCSPVKAPLGQNLLPSSFLWLLEASFPPHMASPVTA